MCRGACQVQDVQLLRCQSVTVSRDKMPGEEVTVAVTQAVNSFVLCSKNTGRELPAFIRSTRSLCESCSSGGLGNSLVGWVMKH